MAPKEILLAFEYRFLRGCQRDFGGVSLGLGLALPHPFHFLRFHVVVLNAVGQASAFRPREAAFEAFLCFMAAELSGNPFAGVTCFVLSFLQLSAAWRDILMPRNRFQTSRLGNYSSSDLRELWGIPLLWIQTYVLCKLFLSKSRWLKFGFVLVTFAFIVSWQFSPFLLLLQATALYFVNIVAGFDSIRQVVLDILNAYCMAMFLAAAMLNLFVQPC